MNHWGWNKWQVIYLPEYDEIILFKPIGMGVITRRGFDFPLAHANKGMLIQVSLGEL